MSLDEKRALRNHPDEGGAGEAEAADFAVERAASERRFQRNSYVVVALLVILSLIFARWQMVSGVILGAALSAFNHRWLQASTGAILGLAAQTGNRRLPRWTTAKFILRYFVMLAVVIIAVRSGWFDLLGICLGLASFVGGVMLEAGYQVYLTFRNNDE
ncbi:MAG TPA: ATP synthase subunit I [Blastocatellia bacterium]|nr:ATP synthase subunit I [Blastocatellia bacterium]